MIIKILNKYYVFPDVLIDETTGNHIIDKSRVLLEYCNEKVKKHDVDSFYTSQGVRDKTAHKRICNELYNLYLDNVKCDYFAVLVFPEKSKSVYGIAIYDKQDTTVQNIIKQDLELTVNSKGKWALRLRLNNKHLKRLADMGVILQEFTPTEWNNECLKVQQTFPNTEFNTLGELFEAYWHLKVNSNKQDAFGGNLPFWESYDVLDDTSINDELGVQCKSQKATICTIDSLIDLCRDLYPWT